MDLHGGTAEFAWRNVVISAEDVGRGTAEFTWKEHLSSCLVNLIFF